MKIYYNSRYTFDLPTEGGVEERLAVVEALLREHKELFRLDDSFQSPRTRNIERVLSQLATYILMGEKKTKEGKNLRHDKEILRKGRLAAIRRRELPLLSSKYW